MASWFDDLWNWFRWKPAKPPAPPTPAPPTGNVVAQLHQFHNAERMRRGAEPLTIDPKLAAAAQRHAEWMRQAGRLSHTGDGGRNFLDRIIREGYQPANGGENIAQGYRSPQDVMVGWMGSAGHKRNILNPAFKHAGYGIAGDYWCAVFASPSTYFQVTREFFDESLPEPLLFSEK